jgi:hypothetical protein
MRAGPAALGPAPTHGRNTHQQEHRHETEIEHNRAIGAPAHRADQHDPRAAHRSDLPAALVERSAATEEDEELSAATRLVYGAMDRAIVIQIMYDEAKKLAAA